ncbi:MAG: hypothetical protein ABL963_15835 [Longimicrobiales bacterium]
MDPPRFGVAGWTAGSLGANRSDGRPAVGDLAPEGSLAGALGARAPERSAAGSRVTGGAGRSVLVPRAGVATPDPRGAAAGSLPRARSEGRPWGAAVRVGADSGGIRFTAGRDVGRAEARGSDPRTAGAAGAATEVVAGRRVAVRPVELRGSSLKPVPKGDSGEGRTTVTPRRPPAAYTVRTRPP